MAGTRQTLSEAIKDELLLVTSFFDETSVFEFPNFTTATPAALIIPARIQAEYDTSMTNKRVYAFQVVLLERIEGESSLEGAYDTMRELEDAVIDRFDLDPMFRDVSLSLPSGSTIIDTLATPSNWERVQDDDMGQFLVAEIEVAIFITRDIE